MDEDYFSLTSESCSHIDSVIGNQNALNAFMKFCKPYENIDREYLETKRTKREDELFKTPYSEKIPDLTIR